MFAIIFITAFVYISVMVGYMVKVTHNHSNVTKWSKVATEIQKSSEILLTLLNDVLDLSKIESGKMILESLDFDISETIHNVISLTPANARKKDLELSYLWIVKCRF